MPEDTFVGTKLKQYDLTSRQREVIILAIIGHSNAEIAKKLHLSEYTIKDHMKDIFRIIGIRNRGELLPKLLNLR
jgi:DNA-binding CsgD family transcriptional regulator